MNEKVDTMAANSHPPAAPDAGFGLSRRGALKVAGAALAGGGAMFGPGARAQTAAPLGRLDYIYFLLNLAYFQASLYSGGYRGEFLSAPLLGQPSGTPTERAAGGPVPFADPLLRDFVGELYETELAQLLELRSLADSLDKPFEPTLITAPKMWLNQTATFEDGYGLFGTIFNNNTNPYFPLYTREEYFLVVISHFKDIVLTAYQGICALSPTEPLFSSFMGVQAYSAAILRDMIYERGKQPGSRLFEISDRLASARSVLDPALLFIDQGVTPVSTASGLTSNIVATDERGRAKQRTPLQVLLEMQGRPDPYREPRFLRTVIGRINRAFYGIT